MGSLNRVELIGNLGKAPEIRSMDNGNKVASFTIATTEPAYSLANGTNVPERTEWHNIVAWGALAGVAERFLKKGQQVFLEGKLKTRSYDDKNGVKRYTTEIMCDKIVLLSGNSAPNQQDYTQSGTSVHSQQNNAMSPTTAYENQQQQQTYGGNEQKDDLPF